jgi:hypothetical protein
MMASVDGIVGGAQVAEFNMKDRASALNWLY